MSSVSDPSRSIAPEAETHPPLLLVEDDLALRLMLEAALRQEGWNIEAAADLAQARARIDAAAWPLALVDLGLPPQPHRPDGGLQVMRALIERAPAAKIIVLTGQDEEAAALQAIQAGAFDFLSKPAPLRAIRQSLARAELFWRQEARLRDQSEARISFTAPLAEGLKAVRAEAEERLIRLVLEETGFNVAQTARRLGLKRENVYYFLKKHGLKRDE